MMALNHIDLGSKPECHFVVTMPDLLACCSQLILLLLFPASLLTLLAAKSGRSAPPFLAVLQHVPSRHKRYTWARNCSVRQTFTAVRRSTYLLTSRLEVLDPPVQITAKGSHE